MATSSPVFEVLLEKRSRGRLLAMSRSWALRTIRLSKQTLSYFEGNDLKGSVDIAGSSLRSLSPTEADNKSFPFEIDTGSEKLLFNASCAETRSKCIEIFSLASKTPSWDEIQAEQVKQQLSERESLLHHALNNGSTPSDLEFEKERKKWEEKNHLLLNEKRELERERLEVRKEKYELEQHLQQEVKQRSEKERIQFLKQGMALPQNQYLQSHNGVYYAVMQSDGNFVVYLSRHAVPANAIWSTNTFFDQEEGPYCLNLTEDGRLVLLDVTSTHRWVSDNAVTGNPDYCLKIEDDGNLVLRDGSNQIIWQTNTSRGDPNLLLPL